MDDKTAPVTEAELKAVRQSMEDGFERVEKRFQGVDERLKRSNKYLCKILDNLVNLERRLKTGLDDHETRISTLETTVGIDAN